MQTPSPVFCPADILLPTDEVDLGRWAVLACDQFTSQPEYWEKAEELVVDAPSTLRMILPEVYLEQSDTDERIEAIHRAMQDYATGVLRRRVQGFVYVERQLPAGVRQGLVGCVDLEAYDYKKGTAPRIRPSENTVEERIPPRLAVRRQATLESPHILMLCDDPARSVIEPIAAKKQELPLLYSQRLMLDGGEVRGWAVSSEKDIKAIQNALLALEEAGAFWARYTKDGKAAQDASPFALAVGDGNHSLATAKAAWEETKPGLTAAERESHPARYCLVELENIQSEAIEIEPIHRVAFGISGEEFLRMAEIYAKENGTALCDETNEPEPGAQRLQLLYQESTLPMILADPPLPVAAGTADAILQLCGEEHPGMRIDYVHGEAAVRELVGQGALGLLLPPFAKSDLFRGVALGGVLPKKTFSMGHAEEKRYYLECRRIQV